MDYLKYLFLAVGLVLVELVIGIDGVISAFDFNSLSPLFCEIEVTGVLDMGLNYMLHEGSLQVWVLVKKRLLLYTYDHGQFQQSQAIPLNDTPLRVCWVRSSVFLQYKDHLVEIDESSLQVISDVKIPTKFSTPLDMKVFNSGSIVFNSSPGVYSLVHNSAPDSVVIRSTVSRDIAYSTPFVFLLNENISVYDQNSGELVQTINMPNIEHICDNSLLWDGIQAEAYSLCVCVDNSGTVSVLDYLNADEFVTRLLQSNQIQTAFDVFHRCENVDCSYLDKCQSHQQAFLYYMKQLQFHVASQHACDASLDPAELLQLFPDLRYQDLPEGRVLTGEVLGRNVHSISEFVLATLKQQSSDPAYITLESNQVQNKIHEAYESLLPILFQAHDTHPSRLVDVALLRLLLRLNDKRVSDFIASPTECEEKDVCDLLWSRGLYSDLAQFYLMKEKPVQALEIWKQLGEGELKEENVDGLKKSCDYLRSSQNKNVELILQFAPWIIQYNPDEGYRLFTDAVTSSASVYDCVLKLLPDSVYRQKYIDYCVTILQLHVPELATEYAHHLIENLLKQVEDRGLTVNVIVFDETPQEVKSLRRRLLLFLQRNKDYDAESVYGSLSQVPLYFEQVTVLVRLQRYREALHLLLYTLRSVKLACECCISIDQEGWRMLLEMLFNEKEEE